MLRARLGEDAFWKGIRNYGSEHRFKSVETSDFRRSLERTTGKSLERFFHDWAERPGHPTLEIKSEYLADSKQLRISIKQTQSGEPFAFPLPVTIISREKGIAKKTKQLLQVDDRELVAYVALDQSPSQVLIDPELTVLAEITETKGRDLWVHQLIEGPTVMSRIRAAAHFGKSKEAADRELLAAALKTEKFWGVAAELASALSATGGDTARDALLDGLKKEHPKARRACVDQLAKFRHDAKAADGLKELLRKGDASYFVEASALRSLAEVAEKDSTSILLPWLAKNSHYDALRVAAVTGLGHSKDLGTLDTLIAWTKRGKTRPVRIAALHALAKLATTTKPNDEQKKAILDAIVACATGKGEMPQIRRNALTSMRDLGQLAASRIDVFEAFQQGDPDEYVQDLTQKAIAQLKANSTAPADIGKLREELQQLKQQNQALQDRLERLEKSGKKGP